MRTTTYNISRFTALLLATTTPAGICLLAACESPLPTTGAESTGALGMQLTVPDGSGISSFAYTIGGGPTAKSGTIDVSKSNTVSAILSGLAAGSGYTISIAGTSDAGDTCAGSAGPFTVTANETVSVSLVVACHAPSTNGNVSVHGTLDACPEISSVSANPSEVTVGNDVAITAIAGPDESDAGHPLVYTWSGVTSSDAKGNATFHCATPGSFSVSVAATNGDSACDSSSDPAANATITVTCDLANANRSADSGACGSAGPVDLDFDSLNASAGAVTGAALSSYFAQYGVSVTDGPDVGLNVQQAPFWEPTSSPPNLLNTFGGKSTLNTGVTYTLTFSCPIATVSFYRAGIQAGSTMGLWSATAFSAANQVLSTVGENQIVSNVLPTQFTLAGPGIASVTFYSNVMGFAGTYLSIDDLTLTP